jgi:hypothetical protein
MQKRKIVVKWGMVALAVLALGACATVGSLLPSSVSQSRESLEQAVKAKAVGIWRYNHLLSLKVNGVQLTLLPNTQRFALRLEVDVVETVFDKRWLGVVTLEAEVRFDAQKNQLVLAELGLPHLEFAGLSQPIAAVVRALAAHILSQRLNGAVVYQVSDSVAQALTTFRIKPGAVKIEKHQVSLELIPQK